MDVEFGGAAGSHNGYNSQTSDAQVTAQKYHLERDPP